MPDTAILRLPASQSVYSLSLSNTSLHTFLNCFPFVVALKGFGPSSFRAISSKLNLG